MLLLSACLADFVELLFTVLWYEGAVAVPCLSELRSCLTEAWNRTSAHNRCPKCKSMIAHFHMLKFTALRKRLVSCVHP